MPTKTEAPQGTQAVIRAIRLLKAFSPDHPELSLADLTEAGGLTKTTTHRLLTALESEGLVARNPSSSAYRLGPAVIALGSQALMSSDLRAAVRPTLEELARQTGETTTLDVLVGDQILILDGVAGRHLVSAGVEIGTRWPIHVSAGGKAILATMKEEAAVRMLRNPLPRFTDATITHHTMLIQELNDAREQGFASTFEELEKDYVAVSAPFLGPLGEVEGAITICGPSSRFNKRRVRSLGTHLKAAADRLSSRHAQNRAPEPEEVG